MDMNNLPHSSSIEYEDKLRAFSRQKPAYPITVFEIEPGWLFRKARRMLSALRQIALRLAGSMKQRQEPSSPVVMRGDSLRLEP